MARSGVLLTEGGSVDNETRGEVSAPRKGARFMSMRKELLVAAREVAYGEATPAAFERLRAVVREAEALYWDQDDDETEEEGPEVSK